MGSFEFSVEKFNVPLILILGHTRLDSELGCLCLLDDFMSDSFKHYQVKFIRSCNRQMKARRDLLIAEPQMLGTLKQIASRDLL